jgi:hypothetical protein
MYTQMINKIINKTVFITGSGKNAGKTTFLNYLIPNLRNKVDSLAYLTIGIDGEQQDMIFGTPKPSIYTETDDYIVTCDSAIFTSDAVFEIVEVFPFSNKLGKLLLVKTLRAGSVELIGPENNTQLNYILNFLKTEKKINTILVDGAVNRITQITSAQNSEFIYVMKISSKDLMTSINRIKTLSLVKNFPIMSSEENSSEEVFECAGALTSIKVSKIPENKKYILINDFTKIFLSWNELSDLLKSKTIFYKEKFHLSCISVNLYDIDRIEFQKILSANNIKEEVVFNPYEYI